MGWLDLTDAEVEARRARLARIASPLGLAWQPRWIDRIETGLGGSALRFAIADEALEGSAGEELTALAVARPQPYWPCDEATLQARSPERLWTIPEDALLDRTDFEGGAPHEVARLLAATWQAAQEPPAPPLLMGIVNVTPDSFSDGGRFLDPDAAVQQGLRLVEAGAHLLDVGGESTRPGSDPVSLEEEWSRVAPVIAGLAQRGGVPISIDTSKAEVARRALEAGATWINDVRAGTADPEMLHVAARGNAHFVAMHCLAPSREMQRRVDLGDPVRDVAGWLRERVAAALQAGVRAERLWLDPGIGFGKHLDHNLSLLRRLWELRSLGCPLLLGVSRKSFIEHLDRAEGLPLASRESSDPDVARIGGTAAAVFACVQAGAAVLRVHDIATMGQAARVAYALAHPAEHPPGSPPPS